MRYSVEFTEQAQGDAREAYRGIAKDSVEHAVRWYEGLVEAIGTLEQHPKRCPLAPETAAFREEIRHLLYGKRGGVYRVLFTILGKTVYVLHVRHGARKHLTPDES